MQQEHSNAAAHADEHGFDRKAIWKTFWILLIITVGELCLAILHYETGFPPKYVLNGVFMILTLAKAFFIIAEFMHLRHEIRNMVMTIAMPALLFIWFIIAFLWDGNSYKNLRLKYDSHFKEQSEKVIVPADKHGHHEETEMQHEGEVE